MTRSTDEGRRGWTPWVDDESAFLLTDQYELTMLQAYWAEGMRERAVFSLFVRSLPETRKFLLACGLDTALGYLEHLRVSEAARRYLVDVGFLPAFVEQLGRFRFTGDVWAMPEGTPFFADEPIVEVEAPLPEAQLVETFLMNQIHLQTVLASKAARVKGAAGDRAVVDFALRRMHGTDAGVKGARALYVGGVDATSNVLAGAVYGIPVTGTMAHSYVQAHEDEGAAFRAFTRTFPETVLLVDTYDTIEGVRRVVELARELRGDFRVRGVRLDSGDLAKLAARSRMILDEAGLHDVRIFASGGLDEGSIRQLVGAGAPIDGFGVGTKMGASADAPTLNMAYKLVSYGGEGRLKLSTGKRTLPGRKQVYRIEGRDGRAECDVIAGREEAAPPGGRPLLRRVMERGRRLPSGTESLEAVRTRAREEIARLPDRLHELEEGGPPYRVDVSATLRSMRDSVASALEEDDGAAHT